MRLDQHQLTLKLQFQLSVHVVRAILFNLSSKSEILLELFLY